MNFFIGIIGCGLIGSKRYKNIGSFGKIEAVSDRNFDTAKLLIKNKKIIFYKNWKEILNNKKINIVIIATYHNDLSKILIESLKKNKNVLVEKPGAINPDDLKKAIKIAKQKKLVVKVGYNHRYHESIIKSKELIKKNTIGELMYIKASYGHGGRPGYEKEWRMKPKISGGGELLDQGSHLIDLAKMYLGNIVDHKSLLTTSFWKTKVDDNSFLILKFRNKKVAFLHASCSEWKNSFILEIYGKKGKIKIDGKGGSYGKEKITLYKMKNKMGKPDIINIKMKNKIDKSWKNEINDFYKDLKNKNYKNEDLTNSFETLKIIKKIYKENKYDNCS
jgi:predicted dehydrogenase